MDRTSTVLMLLSALCAVQPSSAFLQDLLIPLQEAKHALFVHPQPHPQPQPQPPQYYQYGRRVVYDAPPAQQGYGGGYAGGHSRPVVYQWLPTKPVSSYDAGTAYSYGASPFSGLLQNSWFPWSSSNRQPASQPQQQQPLSSTAASTSGQQQPLQAFWSILPWNNNGGAQAGPVLSFFQNPGSLLPWNQQQQASRPGGGVVFTTPLAPAPAHGGLSTQAVHVVAAEAPVSASLASSGPVVAVRPEGLVVDDNLAMQMETAGAMQQGGSGALEHQGQLSAAELESGNNNNNNIRRIALQQVSQDGVPCA